MYDLDPNWIGSFLETGIMFWFSLVRFPGLPVPKELFLFLPLPSSDEEEEGSSSFAFVVIHF